VNRQEIFDHAVKHVTETINNNQELFLAQIIKMNPEINLIEYKICHMYLSHSGLNEFWLEKV
jgi:hypothetical protein